jgi:hypothetical protein
MYLVLYRYDGFPERQLYPDLASAEEAAADLAAEGLEAEIALVLRTERAAARKDPTPFGAGRGLPEGRSLKA